VIIVIIVVAVVLFGNRFFVRVARPRSRRDSAPARAAMPTVCHRLPSVRHWKPVTRPAHRSSRSVFDRVRSLSSVGH